MVLIIIDRKKTFNYLCYSDTTRIGCCYAVHRKRDRNLSPAGVLKLRDKGRKMFEKNWQLNDDVADVSS